MQMSTGKGLKRINTGSRDAKKGGLKHVANVQCNALLICSAAEL